MTGIPCTGQIIHQPVSFRIDLIHFALFGEDLVAVEEVGVADDAGGGAGGQAPGCDRMGHGGVLAAPVLHFVDHQAAVAPRCEKPVIVVTEAHSLDRAGVGLYLADVLHGETPNLHRSRIACLARTRQERLSIRQHLQLRYVVPGLTIVGVVRRVPDFPLVARHDRSSNIARHIDATFELGISWLEIVLFAPSALKSLLLQVVEGDLTLVAAVCETRIVLKPVYVHYPATVAFARLEFLVQVKVIQMCRRGRCQCKHVSAMAELNLRALLHLGRIIVDDRIGQDVHHVEFVADGRNDMETTRVEGYCRCVLARRRLPCHFKFALVPIPNADVTGRTGHNELFAKADIHARDFLVVEGTLHVEGCASLGIRPVKGQPGHQKLIVSVDVIEQIFVNCDQHLADRGRF